MNGSKVHITDADAGRSHDRNNMADLDCPYFILYRTCFFICREVQIQM